MSPELKAKLTSRKFLMAVVAALASVLNELLDNPMPVETLTLVVGVVGAYVVGEGIADAGRPAHIPVLSETHVAAHPGPMAGFPTYQTAPALGRPEKPAVTAHVVVAGRKSGLTRYRIRRTK